MGSVTAARVAAPTLLDVIPSFQRHLRAENKSPRTIQSYTEAVRRLHDFCSANGMPLQVAAITSEHIEAFLADQLARLRPASARARFASLRQFFAWLASRDEREIERSPMDNLKPPKVAVPVPVLSLEHLKALLRAVERDGGFYGRRDAAIVRVFIDTGCRLTELSGLQVVDVELDLGTVTFVGKGGGERRNPIGTKSMRALDRYMRIRSGHRDADSDGSMARTLRADDVLRDRRGRQAAGGRGRDRGHPRRSTPALGGEYSVLNTTNSCVSSGPVLVTVNVTSPAGADSEAGRTANS